MADELKHDDVELSPILAAQEAAEKAAKPAKAETATETPAEAPQEAETEAETTETPEATESAESEAEKAEEDKPKKRGKSAEQRIDELTKARREAERRAEELEARLARLETGTAPTQTDTGPKAPDPNDPRYEFGEADPNYLADLVQYKVDERLANERKTRDASAEAEARQAKIKADAEALNATWNEKAAKATEKYPDFNEVVVESAKAGEWDLLPLSAAAVQGSDVGDDIAYHLATHPEDAKKLAEAERGFHNALNAAISAGVPPQVANMLAAPYLMRGQEIFENLEAKVKTSAPARRQAKVATDAPDPPSHTVRGVGGRFTEDFSSDNCDLSKMVKAIRG